MTRPSPTQSTCFCVYSHLARTHLHSFPTRRSSDLDSAFSESYASFVERQGLAQWRAARGLPPPDEQARQRQARFVRLILDTRERLRRLYALPLQADALRQAKAQVFAELREQYRGLREENAVADYDAFMAGPLNNASLLPFALYDQWVPAFARLFEEVGEDW